MVYNTVTEGGHAPLTRLFQGEMIKLFAINNQLLAEISTLLKQNQVLLFQMARNIETIKANS
jgi:hypothetical protein